MIEIKEKLLENVMENMAILSEIVPANVNFLLNDFYGVYSKEYRKDILIEAGLSEEIADNTSELMTKTTEMLRKYFVERAAEIHNELCSEEKNKDD